ncbi:hypothetical protein LCGC14_0205410 [marine sediment metagenome]|uniref:Signal peptidase I n=1 Tax=marine sediment metagenome TaxID=412755 RepID=A0A0F9XL20_9ZZZZ
MVLMIAGLWKVFVKAGQPGWACLVPVYNGYIVTVEIAKLPILWFILSFVPIVFLIPPFKVGFAVAAKFGKEGGFGIGLIFLPFIFYPILGFGSATYQGAAAAAATPPAPPAPSAPPAA